MKKAKLLLTAVAVSLTLFGCQGTTTKTSTFAPEVSSIFITRDSQIASAIVEGVPAADRYNQDELKQDIELAVMAYNKSKGAAESAVNEEGSGKLPVALRSCTLDEQKAVAIFDYAGSGDLIEFGQTTYDQANQVERLDVSKVSSGFPTDITYLNAADQTGMQTDEISKNGDYNAVVIEGDVTVQTEGKIVYISEGVNLTNEFTAVTPEGKSCIIFE